MTSETPAAAPGPAGDADEQRALMADATRLVLARLEARLAGDDAATRALDEAAAWDGLRPVAVWSAAFGVALEVLRELPDEQRSALIERLRGEVDAWQSTGERPRE